MRSRRVIPLLVLAVVLALAGPAAPAQLVVVRFGVVVNAENPLRELERSAISDLFLGKTKTWPDGTEAAPIDREASSDLRNGFTRAVHGRSTSAVVSHWRQQVFSGKGAAPPEVRSNEEVLKWVREHRGGIGYIDDAALVKDGVRILRIKD